MLRAPDNLRKRLINTGKQMGIIIIVIIAGLVIYGFSTMSQSTDVGKPMPVYSAPVPYVKMDSSALVEERRKSEAEARRTAIIRREAWQSAIAEFKATRDSLKIMKAVALMPVLMAGQ